MSMPMSWESMETASLCRGARRCWPPSPYWNCAGKKEKRYAGSGLMKSRKSATYYGIGMALTRITKAILGDEHSVLTVSAMLRGEYGQMDVFAGVPCIINQNGVQRVLPLSLTPEEMEKLGRSCDTLREGYDGIF